MGRRVGRTAYGSRRRLGFDRGRRGPRRTGAAAGRGRVDETLVRGRTVRFDRLGPMTQRDRFVRVVPRGGQVFGFDVLAPPLRGHGLGQSVMGDQRSLPGIVGWGCRGEGGIGHNVEFGSFGRCDAVLGHDFLGGLVQRFPGGGRWLPVLLGCRPTP
ncbi:hypothetical protein NY78_2532 [Desulfovibrio sp. TomC]|nr:hypothetical protein NY78_2532 [Desulfovibrio sp. TomC]